MLILIDVIIMVVLVRIASGWAVVGWSVWRLGFWSVVALDGLANLAWQVLLLGYPGCVPADPVASCRFRGGEGRAVLV